MPIACLALAALVALAVDFVAQSHKSARDGCGDAVALVAAGRRPPRTGVRSGRSRSHEICLRGDQRGGPPARAAGVPARTSTSAPSTSRYARQSPRERPQGYSTTAPTSQSDLLARRLRGVSCGRGVDSRVTLGVRFVALHRGLYRRADSSARHAPPRPRRRCARRGGGSSRGTGRSRPGRRPEHRGRLCGHRRLRGSRGEPAGAGARRPPAAGQLRTAQDTGADRDALTGRVRSAHDAGAGNGLPGGDPQRARLRRRDRDAARARAAALASGSATGCC